MKALLAICLLLLAAGGIACGNEPVKVDGRTWVWNTALGMYQPDGKGWSYDADRETWWRPDSKATKQPCPCAVGGRCTCGTTCDCVPLAKAKVPPRPPGEGWILHEENYWYRWAYAQPIPQQFGASQGPQTMGGFSGGRRGNC